MSFIFSGTPCTSNSSDSVLNNCSEESRNTQKNLPLTIQTFIQTFLEEKNHCESRVSLGIKLLVILRFSKLASLERFHNRI